MNITEVKLRKVLDEGSLKAVLSVTIDDAFVIHDVKVIQTSTKRFVVMPSRTLADGTRKDVCHPINAATRELFETAVLKVYEEYLENPQPLNED